MMPVKNWNVDFESNINAKQQPIYENIDLLNEIAKKLASFQPIASFDKILTLRQKLANLNEDSFIIQGGDCAEPILNDPTTYGRKTEEFFNEITEILKAKYKKTIKIARIAGQFAKPRSQKYETINGTTFEVYKGDLINGFEFNKEDRKPDPLRMIKGYEHAKKIYDLNLDFYTSHEGLLIPYEASLIRQKDNHYYSSSGDFIWIGNKTRFINSYHIKLFSKVINPIGIKIGPSTTKEEIDFIVNKLNPNNENNKLIFISRMGVKNIHKKLPSLLKYTQKMNYNIIWICDPLHGNTYKDENDIKRRSFNDIISEVKLFFNICSDNNILPSGLHLEMTYENVSECVKQNEPNEEPYLSLCDPRLNKHQTLELLKSL
ncbi:MAG: 3-deoxy-7-phosphoheptulonate synthase [Sphingobacteriia bacterium]|nr:3-deoxy-7-phosphoheptulonate synthase [Sphingobacteriia bacterium]